MRGRGRPAQGGAARAQPVGEVGGEQAVAGGEDAVGGIDQEREALAVPGRHLRVLQDLGVPPWVRDHLPMLSSSAGELLAAGDLAYSAGFDAWLRERGVGLYRKCQTALEQAELRVRLLSDPQDPASAEPFASPDA